MSSRLQALLLGERVLPEGTVRAAVARQLVYGGGLDTALLEMGAMTEAAVWARLAAVTGLPVPAPSLCDGSKVAAEPALEADSTARLRVVPVAGNARTLQLMCAEPVAADDIRRAVAERGFEAHLYVVPELRLLALRQRIYGEPLPQRFAGLLARAVGVESARKNFASPRRPVGAATEAATLTAPPAAAPPTSPASTTTTTTTTATPATPATTPAAVALPTATVAIPSAAPAPAAVSVAPPPAAALVWDAASEDAADRAATADEAPPAAALLWDAASEDAADQAATADDAPPAATMRWDAATEDASPTPLQQVIEHSAPFLAEDESLELGLGASGAQPMDPLEDQSLSVPARLALGSPLAFPERLTPGSGIPVGISPESLTDSATEALCRRARNREDKGRRLALRALRLRMRQPPVRALVAELLAQATADAAEADLALESLVELREERAIPILLGHRTTSRPPRLDEAARQGLVVLTGQDFGRDPRPWEDWCLANAERHRVEWLLQGLGHKHEAVRARAFDELRQVTGETFGYHPGLSRRRREAARRLFAAWWDETGATRRA